MKDMLKLLWVVAAISLVAPTTKLDLRTLLDDAGPPARAGEDAGPRLEGVAANQEPAATPAPSLQYNICPGDSTSFSFQVHLPAAPVQADILFAFDTTGSMDGVIQTAQERAVEIMSNLQALISDVRFGLVDFRDYPFDPYGLSTDWPYRLRQPLINHIPYVQMKIEELEGDGGVDGPEAYSRTLYEAYTDEHIGWRPEARRFIIMFGDSVPHDNDLNVGVAAPQPHRPYETWQTGYPPAYIDPGRDTQNGTEDDLDFQVVLGDLRDHSMTLLFIVSDAKLEGLTIEELLAYWQIWAAMTGPGGDAKALEDLADLPATIQSLVTAAARHVDQLGVVAAPSWFDEWVTVNPPTYNDLDIPPAGLNLRFDVTITVPMNVPANHYMFDLMAIGDGTVYQRQRVEVTVPAGCFATPTPTWVPMPTPRPRWLLYVPFLASNHINWQP
ncbi:MAG: vWA domain-containing protein [Anaerolineae bacterium]